MKVRNEIFATLAIFSFIFLSVGESSAAEKKHQIVLFDPAHRDPAGASIDSDLLDSIQPGGRLGQLVFFPAKEPREWFIDVALIEDVQALGEKEPIAKDWLTKLKKYTVKDQVFPLPYAHPDIATLKRLAPTELNYYYTVAKSRLQKFLDRSVQTDRNFTWTNKATKIRPEAIRAYKSSRKAISLLRSVVPSDQLDLPRSRLALLLSTDTLSKNQFRFAQSAYSIVSTENHKLRIVAGKYRLSSQHEKVPVTLINDFDAPVRISLRLTPLNSRIKVSNIEKVTLAAKSKLQLSVAFTVIASGTTAVLAQFTNDQGTPLVDSAILSLNLSVISPAVAWFTSGAALLLLLAAITQNIRRMRKRKR